MDLRTLLLLAVLVIPIRGQETKPAPQDKADLNPMIAAQAKARSKALKARKSAPAPKARVDLNSATKAELTALPGVTEAMADRLIAGRPYRTKTHAVTQNILPFSVYTSIKDLVVALPPK